jgi:hypothetical protein
MGTGASKSKRSETVKTVYLQTENDNDIQEVSQSSRASRVVWCLSLKYRGCHDVTVGKLERRHSFCAARISMLRIRFGAGYPLQKDGVEVDP